MKTHFSLRRKQFLELIGENSCAVVFGAHETTRNGTDRAYPFRQHSDFWYLTDWITPGAIAFFSGRGPQHFVLVIPDRDARLERYTGVQPSPEEVKQRYGADLVLTHSEWTGRLDGFLNGHEKVFLSIGEHPQQEAVVQQSIRRLARAQRRGGCPPRVIVDLSTILHGMRLIKQPEELAHLDKAITLTHNTFSDCIPMLRQGSYEHEVAAHVAWNAARTGADMGYEPIVAAGEHAVVLHYHPTARNSRKFQKGELVLMDIGCEWEGYTADVTRVFPVSEAGQQAIFSPVQRQVYDWVVRAQEAGIAACRSGATVDQIHHACTYVLIEALLDMEVLKGLPEQILEQGLHLPFFPHLSSHWLGMDVHDVGAYYTLDRKPCLLEPGMVLTIEPGLYFPIREDVPTPLRGIGIRIEDDVLVVPNGCRVLSGTIPKKADEVEAWMLDARLNRAD